MLIILNDPAGASGRQRHAWDFGATIQANIERHLRHGGGCKVLANGREIDPASDPLMARCPTIVDFITVVRRPETGIELGWWIVAAVVASVAVSFALMPKVAGTTTGNDSPNNQLTAQTNRPRAYQAIPDVFGYRRVWPDIIQPGTVEYIDNIKYITEWMCISMGRGTLSNVNYAETPIGDIEGASYEVFAPVPVDGYPELGSTTLLDVLETFESDEVNGQELGYAVPYATVSANGNYAAFAGDVFFTITVPNGGNLEQLKSMAPDGTVAVAFTTESGGEDGPITRNRTGLLLSYEVTGGSCSLTISSDAWAEDESFEDVGLTITPDRSTLATQGPYTLPVSASRMRWNTVFLRGLKGSVDVRAEWWQVDGSGVEIGGTRQSQVNNYTADTYDQRFFTTDAVPTAGVGRYQIQFTRLTVQVDGGGADVAKLEELYAVRHYPTKVLPGVTVIRVTTKATADATGFSDRKFNVRWQRHVRGLISDGLGPSRNFARAMAHIWRLSGNDIAELDTDRLAEINAQFGDEHPLLRFDASLDDADMSLGGRMQLVADSARCVLWRDGQKWTVTRDQARSYPELQLDYRNLAAGGESALSYAAHLPASNDGVEVEYVDETTQAKKAYVRLNIGTGAVLTGESANPLKIKMAACATLSQADNRAQLEARKLLYQRESVSDTALNDAASLGVGSLVRWIDPNDFAGDDGLQAGEVLDMSGNFIRTSEVVDWKGATEGRILLTGADGKQLSAPLRCYPAGELIELQTMPAGVYLADGNRQLGSRYAFAVGLTEAETESAGLYVTTSIKPNSVGEFTVALAQYDERVYEVDPS
ncbi:hypothetical protein GN316_06735 [Xylophilus sp. Kf1]|nr:hypothetical protein [Xylophilus sp. Kf1]